MASEAGIEAGRRRRRSIRTGFARREGGIRQARSRRGASELIEAQGGKGDKIGRAQRFGEGEEVDGKGGRRGAAQGRGALLLHSFLKRFLTVVQGMQAQDQKLRARAASSRQKADEAKASQTANKSRSKVLNELTKLRDMGRLDGFFVRPWIPSLHKRESSARTGSTRQSRSYRRQVRRCHFDRCTEP